jgi:hypothetical protein
MRNWVVRLGTVLAFGMVLTYAFSAMADSAKLHSGWKTEGTWQEIAEGRSYWSGKYWGFSFNDAGQGFGHNMAWNCPASAEIAAGVFASSGFCTMTDIDGDKIFAKFGGEVPLGEPFKGYQEYTGGTGKFAGITGGHAFGCTGVGTDAQLSCVQEAEYTLPQ